MRRLLLLPVLALSGALSGCVSFGVECRAQNTGGWLKVRRIGFSPSKATVENLASFKERVCK